MDVLWWILKEQQVQCRWLSPESVLSVNPFQHKLLRMWYCREAVCSTRCFYSCASLQQGIWAENSRGSLQRGMLPRAELAEGAGKVTARRFAFHGIRARQPLFSQCRRRSYTIAWWAHQWKCSSVVTPVKTASLPQQQISDHESFQFHGYRWKKQLKRAGTAIWTGPVQMNYKNFLESSVADLCSSFLQSCVWNQSERSGKLE